MDIGYSGLGTPKFCPLLMSMWPLTSNHETCKRWADGMLMLELLRTTQFLRDVQIGNGVELSQLLLDFRQTWEAQPVVY